MVTADPIQNLDATTSEGAGLGREHLAHKIGIPGITAALQARALVPVYGATWNKAMLTTIGADRINWAFCLLRNSPVRRSEYERIFAVSKEAFVAAS